MDNAKYSEYLLRRRTEVRSIRDRADAIDRELTEALRDPGAAGQMDDVRLEAWIEGRRKQLEHVEIELFVLATAPRPSPPWWRFWSR